MIERLGTVWERGRKARVERGEMGRHERGCEVD
jgi:hypothetical protein